MLKKIGRPGSELKFELTQVSKSQTTDGSPLNITRYHTNLHLCINALFKFISGLSDQNPGQSDLHLLSTGPLIFVWIEIERSDDKLKISVNSEDSN